ncbi:MAG: ORF6N domain-containing protein, partial [Pseudomonadota bacterium]
AEIEAALDRARVAILLVTQEFIASEFIATVELPALLEGHKSSGLRVLPLICEPCLWDQVPELARFEVRPKPPKALSEITPKAKRQRELVDFAREVAEAYRGGEPSPPGDEKVLIEMRFTDADWDDDALKAALDHLGRMTGIDGEIVPRRKRPGSVRVFVELPAAMARRLSQLVEEGVIDGTALAVHELNAEGGLYPVELFEFRDELVLTDETVARFYGIATKALNQAVKRNPEKFDETHAFQLTAAEWDDLKSQNVTPSGHGGRRTPPWVFTEAGVIMVATVLRVARAIEATKLVVDVFRRARREHPELFGNRGEAAWLGDGLALFDRSEPE